MDNKNNEGFSYTYSAKEQTEIRNIREKYTSEKKEEDKMERLRRLDARVTQKAQMASLSLGIVGLLIMGSGLSLVMSELAELLGLDSSVAIPVGIAIGVVGGVLVSLAYPVYNFIIKRERRKIAPEVIRLTDELMK